MKSNELAKDNLYEIRLAQKQKFPYMLVVGDKEQAAGQVSVRLLSGDDLGPQDVSSFEKLALEVVANKI
jgi:threonyl-tRNA synthetase